MAEPRSQAQTVQRWHDRIGTAKRFRDQKASDFKWETFIKEYKGEYQISLGTRRARMPVPAINEVFSYVQSDIAGMYFRDPYISVNPRKGSTVQSAAIREAAVNYFWRQLGCKAEVESEMLDADLVGHAWNKDGYFAETEGDDDGLTMKSEGMYSMHVSWRDIVFNIGARRPPKDCLWMAHRIIKPLEYVKDKYKGLGDYDGTIDPRLSENLYKQTLYKDDIKVAVLWEIWDAQKREILTIAENSDKLLKRQPWPEYIDEFPFSMLWYYEMPDEAYPMSPIAPWEAQILETNKLFAQALNHVKRWNRQMLLKGGTMTEEDQDKFEEGTDGAIINVPTSGSLAESIRFTDFGTLPPDIYMLLDRLAGIKRETNGQPEFERGGVTKTNTRTLGELQGIATGSKSRQDKRIDRLETHIETVADHLLAHMEANFDVEQIATVVDETPENIVQAFGDKFDPVTKTVRFTKEDIQGEYDVDVKAGSTLPLNKETRLAILKEVLQMAVNIKGPLPHFIQVIILEILHDFQMPQLPQAFEQDQQEAEQAAAQAAKDASIDKAKTVAEAHKRQSQAEQIDLENAVAESQLSLPAQLLPLINGQGADQNGAMPVR